MAARWIEQLPDDLRSRSIPVNPHGSARPWPRPRFQIRSCYFRRVLPQEWDLTFQVEHLRPTLALRLFARTSPKLQQIFERKHMRILLIADAYIPRIRLTNM